MTRLTNVEKQKRFRDRETAKKRDRTLILMIVTDMIHDSTVRCSPEVTRDNVIFDWTGEPEDYANLEAFCQEHGFSFGDVMRDYEQRELALILNKHGLTLAGPPKWTPTAGEKIAFLNRVKEA